MAEKMINDISLDAQKKQLGYTRDEKKSPGDTSALEVVSPGRLRTADVGLSAEQVVKNEDFDRIERTRILRKVNYRLIPLLGFTYLYLYDQLISLISADMARIAFIDRGNSEYRKLISSLRSPPATWKCQNRWHPR
jgi:hypothetical protein